MPVDVHLLTVGVLGGTGPLGRGLARRFAAAGVTVVLGSRSAERGAEIAKGIQFDVPHCDVLGVDNAEAASRADLLVVAVPYEGHADLLAGLAGRLAGKIVVDAVNPLGFDGKGAYALDVPEGSAAQQAERILADSRVTAAFHHVSASLLADLAVPRVEMDVLVLGEDREATDTVQDLAALIPGVRGIYGGRLRNARQVEAFTANLISINRRYKAHAGIRVTDV
ncbi:MAG TPA: NADPH-dependent F420 reductase [Mycobacteriales bacterium]